MLMLMPVTGLQVNTELIVGFEQSAMTDELVARQQSQWNAWVNAFVSLPINLPGFGKAPHSISDTAHKLPFRGCP